MDKLWKTTIFWESSPGQIDKLEYIYKGEPKHSTYSLEDRAKYTKITIDIFIIEEVIISN